MFKVAGFSVVVGNGQWFGGYHQRVPLKTGVGGGEGDDTEQGSKAEALCLGSTFTQLNPQNTEQQPG